MAVSIGELLNSSVITRVISRIRSPRNRLSRFLGMNIGGPSTQSQGGAYVGWDIFDRTRTLAKGRPRGTGPAYAAPQKVGHVSAAVYRSHERVLIPQDKVFRTRPLGSGWGSVDASGRNYISKQESYLAQRFMNTREFIISRMLTAGGFGMYINGDEMIPVESSDGLSSVTIDYQVPAGNKGSLNMVDNNGTSIYGGNIIAGLWTTAATPIVDHLVKINGAFERQHGFPLAHVWINSTLVTSLFANTQLATGAGTANTIFNNFSREGQGGGPDADTTDLRIVFKAVPWVTFHIYDGVLEVNGTETKIIPDQKAIFTPEPSSDWCEWIEGSEIVAENVMDRGTERYGFHPWATRVIDPAGWELKALDNGIPALYIPKCVAVGTVS